MQENSKQCRITVIKRKGQAFLKVVLEKLVGSHSSRIHHSSHPATKGKYKYNLWLSSCLVYLHPSIYHSSFVSKKQKKIIPPIFFISHKTPKISLHPMLIKKESNFVQRILKYTHMQHWKKRRNDQRTRSSPPRLRLSRGSRSSTSSIVWTCTA